MRGHVICTTLSSQPCKVLSGFSTCCCADLGVMLAVVQRVNIPVPVVKIVEVPVDKVVVRDKVVEVPHNIEVMTQRYSLFH